jgi:hypothetical protein
MLHVEKESLVAGTVREVALLRETELRFYIDHIGSIQTMSTLIAGFSFTALISSESINLDDATLLFQQSTGGFTQTINATNGESLILPIYADPRPAQIYAMLMNICKLASVMACLGEMLHVITEALIARLLGSRLALRGPDGSIIRATRHLANALASSTRSFFKGLVSPVAPGPQKLRRPDRSCIAR